MNLYLKEGNKLKIYFMWWRCLIADILFWLASDSIKSVIKEDLDVHIDKYVTRKCSYTYALNYILLMVIPFRSIFDYRIRNNKGIYVRILAGLNDIFLPKCSSVEITGGTFGGGYSLHITIV